VEMSIHPIEYRYGSDEMREIFSRERWVFLAKKVEYVILKSLRDLGLINLSDDDLKKMWSLFKSVDYKTVSKYEKVTKHEIMALVRALADVSGEYGRYIHIGVTSNDILDNVLMLQIKEGLNIIINKLKKIIETLNKVVKNSKEIPILGRTHGRAAIPITYGFKFSLFLDEFNRVINRLQDDKKYIVGKIGGAVGSQVELYPYMDRLESMILNELGLKKARFYTQVIPRDYLAYIILDLAVLSSILEHFANEIRNLQRSEIDEVNEGFSESQVGSSVMPHKKNPIMSEKICGIARVVRSYSVGILENIIIEHERDLRNSSFERTLVPEIFILVDEQLKTALKILDNLKLNKDKALRNIESFIPEIFSDMLVQVGTLNGGNRQEIHERLRKIFTVNRVKTIDELRSIIKEDNYLSKYLNEKDMDKVFNLKLYIDAASKRVDKLLRSL